jgi:hypothetical protein
METVCRTPISACQLACLNCENCEVCNTGVSVVLPGVGCNPGCEKAAVAVGSRDVSIGWVSCVCNHCYSKIREIWEHTKKKLVSVEALGLGLLKHSVLKSSKNY